MAQCACLPPSLYWYQILRLGYRGNCVWTMCPVLYSNSEQKLNQIMLHGNCGCGVFGSLFQHFFFIHRHLMDISEMWCWSGGRGRVAELSLCTVHFNVYCCIIMLHNSTSSSNMSVDMIVSISLWHCWLAYVTSKSCLRNDLLCFGWR